MNDRLLKDEEMRKIARRLCCSTLPSEIAFARAIAQAQDTKGVKAMKDVLECAREAIVDAICCEDGLDGSTGQEVIGWITDTLGDQEEFTGSHSEDKE